MPEHTPETFDLDSAFDTLTTDVRAGTASRGAEHAIGAARRRRTTIGAAAAVALIAIGGVVFSQLGNGDKLSPAGELSVPPPAALDAAAMNAATSGWVSDWHIASKEDRTALKALDAGPACMSEGTDTASAPDPSRTGANLMVSAADQVSYTVFADYDSDTPGATAANAEVTSAMTACTDADVTISYGPRGSVSHYVLPARQGAVVQAWVGRLDNRLGLVMVHGSAAPPSDDDVAALATAILAALQVDESYKLADAFQVDSGSGSASGSATASAGAPVQVGEAQRQIREQDLATALGGWSTWSSQGNQTTAAELPCLGDWSSSTSGMSASIGTTGEQSYAWFDSSTDASREVPALITRLLACDSAQWTVDSTTVPGVVVASYDGGTVWIAQQGPTIALLKLAGTGNPPADVATAVGELVLGTLTD